MNIHVVQPGDTINSIAESYGVPTARLIQDNNLINPDSLVPGQTIVVVYPETIHTVQEGDSLTSIANAYEVSLMQLLRNNPHLSGREYIYPGETIVISYNTGRKVETNGYAFTYINQDILRKTLPNLTYLSIYNYNVTKEGKLIAYDDDTVLIQLAKDYSVVPLMLATTLSLQGKPDIEASYDLLLNDEMQEIVINNAIDIIKTKGYFGANLVFYFINTTNQNLYQKFISKVSNRLKKEGYLLFVTINPGIGSAENEITFEKVDYSMFSQQANNITFMDFIWGTNYGPPIPVSSNYSMRTFLDYAVPLVSPNTTMVGVPVIGYNWDLPYVAGSSKASSMTFDSIISLAHDVNATIQFDETSQTPYFNYNLLSYGSPEQHIVWFEDARTINSLMKLLDEYALTGFGVWNIMIYYTQLWLVVNSQYEIVKAIPEEK